VGLCGTIIEEKVKQEEELQKLRETHNKASPLPSDTFFRINEDGKLGTERLN
jgi:hypothetical protein